MGVLEGCAADVGHEGGGGGAETVTERVVVAVAPWLSVTVSMAVNEPAVV